MGYYQALCYSDFSLNTQLFNTYFDYYYFEKLMLTAALITLA